MANIRVFICILGTFLLFAAVMPATAHAQEERREFRQRVERFHQAREDFRQQPTELQRQQSLLLGAIDAFIQHAQLLHAKTAELPGAEEQLVRSIQQEIQADIAALEAFKERSQSAGSTAELRAIAAELKEHRDTVAQEKVGKLMVLFHVGLYEQRIVHVASARANSIAQRLDEFQEVGAEITGLRELLQQAENNIAQASNNLQNLRSDIATTTLTTRTLQETRITFLEIEQKVVTAYQLFRAIARHAQKL